MEAADEGAVAGLGEVVGGLVGGGNVGKADGAVADRLLAQPMELAINVMELLCGSGGGSVRHVDAGRIVLQQDGGSVLRQAHEVKLPTEVKHERGPLVERKQARFQKVKS